MDANSTRRDPATTSGAAGLLPRKKPSYIVHVSMALQTATVLCSLLLSSDRGVCPDETFTLPLVQQRKDFQEIQTEVK